MLQAWVILRKKYQYKSKTVATLCQQPRSLDSKANTYAILQKKIVAEYCKISISRQHSTALGYQHGLPSALETPARYYKAKRHYTTSIMNKTVATTQHRFSILQNKTKQNKTKQICKT